MPDLLDQLQLLVGCEYLSDMRVIPYINEQAKRKLMSMRPEDFPSSQWKEAVSYLFDFLTRILKIEYISRDKNKVTKKKRNIGVFALTNFGNNGIYKVNFVYF